MTYVSSSSTQRGSFWHPINQRNNEIIYAENSYQKNGQDGKYETVSGVTRQRWNPYQFTDYRWYSYPGYYLRQFNVDNMGVSYIKERNPELLNTDVDLYVSALAKLLSAVKTHKFNLGVFAGESRESLRLLTETAEDIFSAYRSLRRGRIRDAINILASRAELQRNRKGAVMINGESIPRNHFTHSYVLKKSRTVATADSWLKLQYGVLPLISDCYEAGKAFGMIMERPRRTTITRSAQRSLTVDLAHPAYRGNQYRVNGKAFQRVSIKHEIVEDLRSSASLGLLDPYYIAWNLVPFSFVVDWFLPIGDYLEQKSAIPRLTGRSLLMAERREVSLSCAAFGEYEWAFLNTPSCRYEQTQYKRLPVYTLSVPAPRFKPLSETLNVTRFFNAIALGVSLRK